MKYYIKSLEKDQIKEEMHKKNMQFKANINVGSRVLSISLTSF